MSKAIELADYCDGLALEIDHTHFTGELTDAAAELRRLAAVEQENANLLAANKYSLDMMNQALQELADMKAAMSEPSHIKSKKQTAHELDAMKKYIEKITKDKDSAVGFLTRAGIIDGSGELAEQYRNIESKAKP